jgi:hypothetical protein
MQGDSRSPFVRNPPTSQNRTNMKIGSRPYPTAPSSNQILSKWWHFQKYRKSTPSLFLKWNFLWEDFEILIGNLFVWRKVVRVNTVGSSGSSVSHNGCANISILLKCKLICLTRYNSYLCFKGVMKAFVAPLKLCILLCLSHSRHLPIMSSLLIKNEQWVTHFDIV